MIFPLIDLKSLLSVQFCDNCPFDIIKYQGAIVALVAVANQFSVTVIVNKSVIAMQKDDSQSRNFGQGFFARKKRRLLPDDYGRCRRAYTYLLNEYFPIMTAKLIGCYCIGINDASDCLSGLFYKLMLFGSRASLAEPTFDETELIL